MTNENKSNALVLNNYKEDGFLEQMDADLAAAMKAASAGYDIAILANQKNVHLDDKTIEKMAKQARIEAGLYASTRTRGEARELTQDELDLAEQKFEEQLRSYLYPTKSSKK